MSTIIFRFFESFFGNLFSAKQSRLWGEQAAIYSREIGGLPYTLYCVLFLRRNGIEADLQLFIGGNVVAHGAIVIRLVCCHIKVAGTGQTEQDGLSFAGLLALERFVDCGADGVAGLRRRKNGLHLGELNCRIEYIGLLDRNRLHITVVVQLGEDRTHAVVAQAACVVGRGHEAVAERVHAGQRRNMAGIAEIVNVLAAGKRRAGGRFHRDDARVSLAEQLILHERRDQAAEVGAAAGTTDHDIRILVEHLHSLLALQTDDGLV